MAASNVTKKYRRGYWITHILSICLIAVPLVVFCIIAFCEGDATEKFTLGCTATVAMLLTLVNVIFKYHIRSTIWIVMIGIYVCMQDIMPMIITIGACTIVDEFIVSPMCKSYKNKLTINKEIDKRL